MTRYAIVNAQNVPVQGRDIDGNTIDMISNNWRELEVALNQAKSDASAKDVLGWRIAEVSITVIS